MLVAALAYFMEGRHGDDEESVFSELCVIVKENISLLKKQGKSLPLSTSGRDYANKMLDFA